MPEPFSQHLADEIFRLKAELREAGRKIRRLEASRELWKLRYQRKGKRTSQS